MIKKTSALAAVLLLLCFACNNTSQQDVMEVKKELSKEAGNMTIDSGYMMTDTSFMPQGQQQQPGEKKTVSAEPQRTINWDKKIVKTASLSAEVKDYKVFSSKLSEKTRRFGGYISSEQLNQSGYKIENTVVIKVPVDQFENAVNDLMNDVSKVNEKTITSEDVTTELIDGRSRLEAKKQVRLRYLDLLRQAKNMEEILNVQKEINGIQEEIETVTGRINFLGHSSALSTINLTFFQVLNAAAATETKEPGFLTKIKTAFSSGWYWVGELFVGIVGIWPLVLLIFLGLAIFRKRSLFKTK